ncbi:unnamed protein product, partial [Rotaria sp. Silwood2]
LNIGGRLGPMLNINSTGASTINDESVAIVTPSSTQRQRHKRAHVEVDDDDIILTNGNGH